LSWLDELEAGDAGEARDVVWDDVGDSDLALKIDLILRLNVVSLPAAHLTHPN
jgi:hypothetical protein